eukprot:403351084
MQKGSFNQVRFKDGNMQLVQRDIPQLTENQVLIKVVYTSVNEYDKIMMDFCYKKECACGSEGSGIIEDIAQGLDQNLKGRKVAFIHDGWSQYVVKDQDDLLYLDNNVDLRIAADAIVNPMTALGLRKICLDLKTDLIVLDSATTQMGRMLIKVFQKENIDIIPLVQEKKFFDQMREEFQLQYILDQNQGDFLDKLYDFTKDRQKVVYISMSGGDLPGRILDKLPAKAEMIILGNLAEKELTIPCSSFFLDSKKIRGFFLERYLKEDLDEDTQHKFFHCIADDLKKGGSLFGTQIAKEMKLNEWEQALSQLDDRSLQGKIILQCN